MKTKELTNKVVAIVLSFVMVLSAFSGITFTSKAAGTTITPMDFAGFVEGTYSHHPLNDLSASGTYAAGVSGNIIDLELTYGTQNTFNDFVTVVSANGWEGVRVIVYNEGGNDVMLLKDPVGGNQFAYWGYDYDFQRGVPFNLKLEPTINGTSVELKVTINGKAAPAANFTGVNNLGNMLAVYCAADTSTITVNTPGLENINPTDFTGFTTGIFDTSSTTTGTLGSYTAGLNNTCFEANLTFGAENQGNDYFQYACNNGVGGLLMFMYNESAHGGDILVFRAADGSAQEFIKGAEYGIGRGTKFGFKLYWRETAGATANTTTVTFRAEINGKSTPTWTYSNLNSMGHDMCLNLQSGAESKSTITVEAPDAKKITPADFVGFVTGTFDTTSTVAGTLGSYASELDNTCFEADLTFGAENQGNDYFQYACDNGVGGLLMFMYNESAHGGDILVFRAADGSAQEFIKGADYGIGRGTKFNFKLYWYTKAGTPETTQTVTFRAEINGKSTPTWTYSNLNSMGNDMCLNLQSGASSNSTIAVEVATSGDDNQGGETPAEYTVITPSNFAGFAPGTYTTELSSDVVAKGSYASGLDHTCLDMNITFGENNHSNDYFQYASNIGAGGILIFMYNEGGRDVLCFRHPDGSKQEVAWGDEWGIGRGQKFNLKLYLDKEPVDANGNATMTLRAEINGRSTDSWTYTSIGDAGDNMYINLQSGVGSGASITIADPGYHKVVPSDYYGFADDTYRYIGQQRLSAKGEYIQGELDETYMEMNVTFGEKNSFNDYIALISDGGYAGVRVTMFHHDNGDDVMLLKDPIKGTEYPFWGNDFGFELGEQFNLKAYFDLGDMSTSDTRDVTVTLEINGKKANPVTFTNMKSTGYNMGVYCSTPAASITVKTPQQHQKLTFRDYGIADNMYSSAVDGRCGYLEDVDGLEFSGILTFSANWSSESFSIGGWDYASRGSGLKFFISGDNNNVLVVEDWFNEGTAAEVFRTGESLLDKPLNLDLKFTCVGTDLHVEFYVNNMLTMEKTFAGAADKMGAYMYIGSGSALEVESVGEKVVVERNTDFYDLDVDGPFLITAGTSTVNGDYADTGNLLELQGEYSYIVEEEQAKYAKKVVLYKLGDVDLDGTPCTESDLTALETLLSTNEYDATAAVEKAADLNNDGHVGRNDWSEMSLIINGTTNLANVKAKYHVPALTYDFLGGDDVMPIGGYYGPYNAATVTDDVYKMLSDAGINLFTYTQVAWGDDAWTSSLMKTAFELGEKYGIGHYVTDYALNPEYVLNAAGTAHEPVDGNPSVDTYTVAAQLGKYNYYDSVLGTMVKDEPLPDGYTWTSATSNLHYNMLKYYDGIGAELNKYANTNGYMNAYPSISQAFDPSNQYNSNKLTYSQYWDDYIARTDPKLLSFDEYPIENTKNGTNGKITWLGALATVRQKSIDNDIPFWHVMQAGGRLENSSTSSLPTEAETYWMINATLAFGAKGITYFTSVQPEDRTNVGEFGLITKDGEKGQYYDYIAKANKQIQAVDEVLMKSKSLGVAVTDATQMNENIQQAESVRMNDDSPTILHQVASTTTITETLKHIDVGNDSTIGTMVGIFDYQGTEAYYVVNCDTNATDASATYGVKLQFHADSDYRLIQDGETTYGTTTNKEVSLVIPAGQAVLVVLEDRTETYSDFQSYRTNDVLCAPDAKPGYVFAGWYKDDACAQKITTADAAGVTNAVAKFVPDEVLGVKAQLKSVQYDKDGLDTTRDIRFVTTADSLEYDQIGFKIQIEGYPAYEHKNSVVYTTLVANERDYLPTHWCMISTYFKAYTLYNIPESAYNTPITVTPFWVTWDGTKVYGDPITKTVNMGLKAAN